MEHSSFPNPTTLEICDRHCKAQHALCFIAMAANQSLLTIASISNSNFLKAQLVPPRNTRSSTSTHVAGVSFYFALRNASILSSRRVKWSPRSKSPIFRACLSPSPKGMLPSPRGTQSSVPTLRQILHAPQRLEKKSSRPKTEVGAFVIGRRNYPT